MTRQELLDDVQARLAPLWSAIQTRQVNYAAAHSGAFFQGKRTHSVIPTDGVDAMPDRLADHPTDQAATWNDFGGFPALSRFTVELHAYVGPAGPGHLAIIYTRYQGEVWTRQAQSGPETGRNRGWSRAVLTPADAGG